MESHLAHTFRIVETFKDSAGKFGDTLGNVAVIDCNHVDEYFAYSVVGGYADEPEFNFCQYAQQVVGVLDDQIGTYGRGLSHQSRVLALAGNQMMDALSMDANVTTMTPTAH